jgi:putative intracellular protease/amidase
LANARRIFSFLLQGTRKPPKENLDYGFQLERQKVAILATDGFEQSDLKNAGANWVDQEVVVDGQFITSRKPDDIPAFSKAIIEAIDKGVQQRAA